MKTISVYDAVKLATKGPIKPDRGDTFRTESAFDLHQYSESGIGKWVAVVPAIQTGHNEAKINANLLAHFFNHGPSLLAMLEEFVKLYEPFRKQLDANETQVLDEAIALIAKASKVEVEG